MVDIATYKAQFALIADALNIAWIEDLESPMTPLRQLGKQIDWDAAAGLWVVNEAYIDSAYLGHYPSKKDDTEATIAEVTPVVTPAAGIIDIAGGTIGVPATFTFSGYFLAGTFIDILIETDTPSANAAPITTGVSRTAEETAQLYAQVISGIDNFTAFAVGAVVNCEPIAPATTCTLSGLIVTNP